jgi:hypothetical protein
MRNLFAFLFLPIFALFAFPQLGSKVCLPMTGPSLQQIESQIRAWRIEITAINKMKEDFRFQSPSMSHISIPYLSILAVQLEASSVQRIRH